MNQTYVLNRDEENIEDIFCALVLSKDQYNENALDSGNRNVLSSIISRILKNNNDIAKITVSVEEFYVDKIYRNCYYNHFSGKHHNYSRNCKRVFLFAGDCSGFINDYVKKQLQKKFIGCFVVKPLVFGSIGRTFLNSAYCKEDKDTIYVRNTKKNVLFNGMKLCIDTFPYSMQDGETLTCAESTLLNIFDYASGQYSDYKFMYPSEIFDLSRITAHQRNLPTKGLSYKAISKIMYDFGFYPLLYINDSIEDSVNMNRILSYYIESGIPVGVGLEADEFSCGDLLHSVVFIGHGKNNVDNMMGILHSTTLYDDNQEITKRMYVVDTADSIDKYIVMDDNIAPYSSYEIIKTKTEDFNEKIEFEYNIKSPYSQPLNKIDKRHKSKEKITYSLKCICVPLHKRMCLEAENARDTVLETLRNQAIDFDKLYSGYFENQTIGTADNPFVIRLFLASSRNLKDKRISVFDNKKDLFIKNIYNEISLPQFVWVCELYDKEHYAEKKPLGEIVLDATSSVNTTPFNSVILTSFLNTCLVNSCGNKKIDAYFNNNNNNNNNNNDFRVFVGKIYPNTYNTYANNLYAIENK